jgi:hypothetical protein
MREITVVVFTIVMDLAVPLVVARVSSGSVIFAVAALAPWVSVLVHSASHVLGRHHSCCGYPSHHDHDENIALPAKASKKLEYRL